MEEMLLELTEGLWTFPIVLPDNPLKWLNCYVVKSNGGRDLLIDTGFNRQDCLETLLAGMSMLKMRPENTDVFITHMHSDHMGNAGALAERGSRIIMSQTDGLHFASEMQDQRVEARERAAREGFPRKAVDNLLAADRAVFFTSPMVDAIHVNEGDVLNYGSFSFACISTPGHTPGHMCLYDRQEKIMILGDHVLFDITPNICSWPGIEDSLGLYLDSLEKISAYDVALALPGHRSFGTLDVTQRVAELKEHHRARLEEVSAIAAEDPGLTGYQIASRMRWHIQAEDWEHFPEQQKFFAFSEAVAHLDHLVHQGVFYRWTDRDGICHYNQK